MQLIQLLLPLLSVTSSLAFPSADVANAAGVVIKIPRPIKDTSLKVIPDKAHPFRKPGPNDQRGPCPGLNTLANHGYLPRNGIASIGEIADAVQEGFNMEFGLGIGIAAFGMLTRGNVLLNKLSIGGPSRLVPPLPGNIDGTPGGLATHGRFEGDNSMFRQDFAIGDNVHFQQDLFDQMLTFVDKLGNGTVIDANVLSEFKFARFQDSIARNPSFEFHILRETFSFGEAGFTLGFFPNATEGFLTVPVATSIFANQRFPENWHRRGSPLDIGGVGGLVDGVATPHISETLPGAVINGTYVLDPPPSGDGSCSLYNSLIAQVPASLLGPKATKNVKRNTQVLLGLIEDVVRGDCPRVLPGQVPA